MRTRDIVIVLIILLIAGSAIGMVFLLRSGMLPLGPAGSPSYGEQCRMQGGTWIDEHVECERAAEEWCSGLIESSFDPCASACRHNPDPAVPCTLECVPVCSFPMARPSTESGPGPSDITYVVDGNDLVLQDGAGTGVGGPVRLWAQVPAADLDGDGDADVPVILAADNGGMYYVAVALAGEGGYSGTNAVRIGSDIALQTVHIREGRLLVNYAARHPWEGEDVLPSVGRTKRLLMDGNRLVEEPREQLSSESARVIAVREWGDCAAPDCGSLTIQSLDGGDGVWYVVAEYSGLADDSVLARRLTARVHYASGSWALGEVLREERRCRAGRGQQDYSEEPCI